MEKNLEPRKGYLNRHIDPLPTKPCTIEIITKNYDGEHFDICTWEPYNPDEYKKEDQPYKGYIGTASTGTIGFHAWEQNNSEFVYYKIIKDN